MEKLISIVGLTSSGKSDLGVVLAKKFNGEIVSADSRQVYKNLDYCSGKVNKEEMQGVPHHLLNVTELGNQFTIFDFQRQAYDAIDDIISRGKVPFLVGGSGLYQRAVTEGYNLVSTKPNEEERENFEVLSLEELKNLCESRNIELPAEVTKRRLIRLLEKGENKKPNNKPKYKVLQIGIFLEREKIYERIRLRLEKRMPNMIKEIQNLLAGGVDAQFLQSLGLEAKCVTDYLNGVYKNYDEFFEDLFKQERHFAKRQQTWFNKDKNLIWLNAEPVGELEKNAEELVRKFLNEK